MRRVLVVCLLGFCLRFHAAAQMVTASVSGTVVDSSGAVISEAAVKLVSATTGNVRTSTSNRAGTFVFSAVVPGAYDLVVEHEGFKKYEKKNIVVIANDVLSAGEVRLEIGAVAEQVTVTAEGASVQTASGERSGIISSNEVQNLTIINRDFAVLASLQPGIVMDPGSNEVQTSVDSTTFNSLGGRSSGNSITLDGMPTESSRPAARTQFVSMDAVAEVKILVSNFQAEFGRKPGAGIMAVTKSGTQDFHGSLYWYKRHEQFNANDFFNNRNGMPIAPYRYTTAGATIGGPIFIPGKFNPDRRKLFFFFSTEQIREARPQPIRQVTMPTQAERNGDFSKSLDLNSKLIPVLDPLNGRSPFPGNVVPANRISKNMQNYLRLLPLPNVLDTTLSAGRYNYQVQDSQRSPKHTETFRTDYNVGPGTMLYARLNHWWEQRQGFIFNSNWGWLPESMQYVSESPVISATRILSPTTVLEMQASFARSLENDSPLQQEYVDRLTRANAGVNIPQFHPELNPLNLVPQATFGGISMAASTVYEARFPLRGAEDTFNWNTALTRHMGSHVAKAGLALESWLQIKGETGNFAGTLDFSRDTNSPLDSNHPYANALLGDFRSYTESSTRPATYGRSSAIEWYAQDNWKVTRSLTLDFGTRFAWWKPFRDPHGNEAGFVLDRWNPAQAIGLVEPALINGKRVGLNPLTGATYPQVAIGAIVPGSGNPFNGMVVVHDDPFYRDGLRRSAGPIAAPRFGFAWDPFRKGKTAVRGGFGVFYQMQEMNNRAQNYYANPPLQLNPTVYYGTLDSLMSSRGFDFPSATSGIEQNPKASTTMNYSFGIQQNVGFGTVVDFAYVASLSRHFVQSVNLNSVPFGTDFLPQNRDTTLAARPPLSAAFLRPFAGYGNIQYFEYNGNSSYHSMQVSANRRFAHGFQYGFAWTWSKAINYTDTEGAYISALIDPRVWNYGKAGFDRTHVVKIFWTWDLPRVAFAGPLLTGWQLSSIATFMSGVPNGINLSFIGTTDITGSPTDGARVVVVENPTLPKSERTFSRNFNTDAFRAPQIGTFGNASKDVFRGPGVNNWDVSLFRNFRLKGERWKAQFRGEFYNTFNHTQFTNLDTNARFDAAGNQTNTRFGEFLAARQARRVQLGLRVTF